MSLAPIHLHPLLEIYALVLKKDCHYIGHSNSSYMRTLVNQGLIEGDSRIPPFGSKEPHGWVITRKGAAYIEGLLATPMPVQTWEVPRC